MTLDELKKLAETQNVSAWFSTDELTDALKRVDISVFAEDDARYIATISPETVLKLLEMIETYHKAVDGIRCSCGRPSGIHSPICAELIAFKAEQRICEIERSL